MNYLNQVNLLDSKFMLELTNPLRIEIVDTLKEFGKEKDFGGVKAKNKVIERLLLIIPDTKIVLDEKTKLGGELINRIHKKSVAKV